MNARREFKPRLACVLAVGRDRLSGHAEYDCRLKKAVTAAALMLSAGLASCGGGGVNTVPVGSTNLGSLSQTCAALRSAAPAAAASAVPSRLYVTYRAAAAARATQSIDARVNAVRVVDLGIEGTTGGRLITLGPNIGFAAAIAALRQSPDVVDVQPTHQRTISGLSSNVNDPLANNLDQWYLYKTNVFAAWATTHGAPSVSIAIIDTGIDETNADFTVAFKEKVVNGVKTTGNGSVQDTNGHGTAVAGLAAALANNAIGLAGVGYNTSLQIYDIFPPATSTSDTQSADTGDEAQAIRDAVSNGASVINISFGSDEGVDEVEQSAINFALSNNVPVVAQNGNGFLSGCGNVSDYPAGYPGVIAVGASVVDDGNSGYSSYSNITSEAVASYSNSAPTLVAPGGDVDGADYNDRLNWIESYSTTTAAYPPDQCSNSGGICRNLFNGSSYATGQVSGAAALIIAAHGGSRMSAARVLSILTQSADVLPGIPALRQGAGRLNVGNAVAVQ